MNKTLATPEKKPKSSHVTAWMKQAPAVITALIAIGGFGYSIYHDRDAMDHQEKLNRESVSDTAARDRESRDATATEAHRAPYLQKQLMLYFEVCQATSVIATSSNAAAWDQAFDHFWELYWGDLVLVESPFLKDRKQMDENSVESNMVRFGDILTQVNRNSSANPQLETAQHMQTARNRASLSALRRAKLQSASISLAEACRRDIKDTWGFSIK